MFASLWNFSPVFNKVYNTLEQSTLCSHTEVAQFDNVIQDNITTNVRIRKTENVKHEDVQEWTEARTYAISVVSTGEHK